jgi:hypothetical protein
MGELSGKWSIALNHPLHVSKVEVVWMLLRWVVPRYEMQIAIHSGIEKLWRIANDSVEVTFWGRYKVGIVHEYSSRYIIPSPYGVINKRSR